MGFKVLANGVERQLLGVVAGNAEQRAIPLLARGIDIGHGDLARIRPLHEGEQFEKDAMARGENLVEAVRTQAQAAGVDCDTLLLTNDHPWEAIIEAANTKGCDLIFMASHGRRGLSALLLGSETTKVLTHSKIPVLVYR